MDHTKFLVEVELTWVQDPASSPYPSWRLLTNKLRIIFKIYLAQNERIAHVNFPEERKKELMWLILETITRDLVQAQG